MTRKVVALGCVVMLVLATAAACGGPGAGETVVGLITKTDTNPFFVKMKEGAQKEADAKGAKLLTAAGAFDADNAGQTTAVENMVTAGAQGILITPGDTKGIVPAIQKARDAGVLVTFSLVRAWASTDGALRSALRRRIARAQSLADALDAGRYPSRAELLSWVVGEDATQLAFPELMSDASTGNLLQFREAVRNHVAVPVLRIVTETETGANSSTNEGIDSAT